MGKSVLQSIRSGSGILLFSLCLVLACSSPALTAAGETEPERSGIRGRIVMKDTGEPVSKGYVYGYVARGQTRAVQMGVIGISDWISQGSDETGMYKLDLPPGDYFVVARKRASGLNYGPLFKGDWYDHSTARSLVVVRKGEYRTVNFELVKLAEPMFFQGLTASGKATDTGIKGRLLNESGEHVPGTFVIAYINSDMRRAPDFASTLTDDEGYYTLYLPGGGRYWLAARTFVMKLPQKGEPFARYEGSPDHSIMVEKGRFLQGIDLVLRPYTGDPSGGSLPGR